VTRVNEGFEYRTRLGGEANARQLLEYLAQTYSKFSRDEWRRRIESGRVLVDEQQARADTILRAGQWLVWARPPWDEPDVPLSFAILHRSAEVLAVAKPSGLPTVPGGGSFVNHTLLSLVRRHFPGASPLHRLGRATSGIVLFATTSRAFSDIAAQWRRGEVLKRYLALVVGSPLDNRFPVDVPIGPVPHPLLGTINAASPAGKRAHSDVTVLERRDGCALVEVRILTGRPHQIRIHLAAAGHPLVGDRVYAVGGAPARDCRALPGEPGYHLHAALLGFTDPATGGWTEVTCGPPPILRASTKVRI
jgi:23S rRNA pseudouridine1911/1915/1917 synthase